MSRATRTGGRDATKGIIPGRVALSVGRPSLPEPPGFRWRLLTDLARLESGHTPSRGKTDYWGGDIPWVGIRDATGNHGRVIQDTADHVTQAGLDNSSARLLPAGTVCLSRTASVGYVVEMGQPMATSQDFVNWVCGPDLNHGYLRYLLMLEQESIRRFAHGTTHQTMYYPEAKALHVLVPERPTQDAIAAVLRALDDKAAANGRIVRCLGELASAAFSRAEQEGSELIRLDNLAKFHNRRRVPLSSREREARKGGVPYYGAAGVVDYVDEALFDEALVLVGEDGSVIRDDGTPVVQYIWGPAWVNNHAHVLTGSGISTEALRVALTRASVAHLVTGAVQPKISMGNLKQLQLRIPIHVARLDSELATLAAFERAAVNESLVLTRARDELLHLLLSGRVRVRDAERVVEGVA